MRQRRIFSLLMCLGSCIAVSAQTLPLDPTDPTGISDVNVNKTANGVFLRNGKIIIVKNNKEYTVGGVQMVKK